MKQYRDLVTKILTEGVTKGDRTGTGTKSIFGYQTRFDLNEGFPILTTKRVFWKGVVEELLWMLRGETNVGPLQKRGVTIWDEWADPNGELGPVYGAQWRSWPNFKSFWNGPVMMDPIDQIQDVINEIRRNPNSRRLIVTAWNPSQVDDMRLPPCHMMFQFYVADGKLSCQLYQRSSDVFLGVPFNWASYALLTHIIAAETGLGVGEFIWSSGDTHIYLNHIEQVELQLTREPRPLPRLLLSERPWTFETATLEDFALVGYDPHPPIKGEVAV